MTKTARILVFGVKFGICIMRSLPRPAPAVYAASLDNEKNSASLLGPLFLAVFFGLPCPSEARQSEGGEPTSFNQYKRYSGTILEI